MKHPSSGFLLGLGFLASTAGTAWGTGFSQTNLVSDIPGLAAITDPSLINPWGVSFGSTSPFWVSDQGANVSTLYSVTSAGTSKLGLTVAIPQTASPPQGPTGQVNNATSSFVINGAPANFIFANLNGTISAWNSSLGTTAQIQATTPGAVYTGLATANSASGPRLYAADGAQNRIDVFSSSFTPVSLGSTAFQDPDPRLAGLVPFNVQTIGGDIYVTYAPATRSAQIAAPEGVGGVAVFDANGTLIRTLITDSKLASPWGITLAPAAFGAFGDDLLVGNFSYAVSEINAFDPTTGAFLGTITGANGAPVINSGLWSLTFGNGGSGGSPDILYFSAGINGEADGLFGAIAPIPEPGTLALLGAGVLGLCGMRWRRAT